MITLSVKLNLNLVYKEDYLMNMEKLRDNLIQISRNGKKPQMRSWFVMMRWDN